MKTFQSSLFNMSKQEIEKFLLVKFRRISIFYINFSYCA